MKTIEIDGIKFAPLEMVNYFDEGLPYVIIRTYSAGVHAGYLKDRNGKEVTLINTRRIWSWEGAFTLSQLSLDGTSKPKECKFSCVIPEIVLTEAIEIIRCSKKSFDSLQSVKGYEYE